MYYQGKNTFNMFRSPTTSFLRKIGTWGPQQLSGSDRPTDRPTSSKMTWRCEINDVRFQRSNKHPNNWRFEPQNGWNLGWCNILFRYREFSGEACSFLGAYKRKGQSSDGFLSPIETTCLKDSHTWSHRLLIILVHLFGQKINVERVGYSPTLPGICGMQVARKCIKIYFNPSFQPKKNTWKQQTKNKNKENPHTRPRKNLIQWEQADDTVACHN